VRPADAAIKNGLESLPADASFADKVEFCVFGKGVRRLRDWELWLLQVRHPERYNMMPPYPEDRGRSEQLTAEILANAKRKLGEYLADAVCHGNFESVSAEILKASHEYASHDTHEVKLSKTQMRVFEEWIGGKRRTDAELLAIPTQKERNDQIGFNQVFDRALHVLLEVCAAKHPVHAAVLMFSRRPKPWSVSSLLQPGNRIIAASAGGALESNLRELWQIRNTTWRFEAFEEDTQPEAIIATRLRDRVAGLIGKAVPTKDITRALRSLRITLPRGKGGRPKRV
jgi:hypothetical protein